MKWLKDVFDSFGWLEMSFFVDEEKIIDACLRVEPEIDWALMFDRFTSANFISDTSVVFTMHSNFTGRSRYMEACMQKAFENLYDESVSITILREAYE